MKITNEQAQEMIDACNDLRIPIAGAGNVAYEWYANQFFIDLHNRGRSSAQILKEDDLSDGMEVISYNMRKNIANWERARMSAKNGIMTIKMEAAGTGTIRKAIVYPESYKGLKINITDTAPGAQAFQILIQEHGVTRYSLDHKGVSRWYDAEGKLLTPRD